MHKQYYRWYPMPSNPKRTETPSQPWFNIPTLTHCCPGTLKQNLDPARTERYISFEISNFTQCPSQGKKVLLGLDDWYKYTKCEHVHSSIIASIVFHKGAVWERHELFVTKHRHTHTLLLKEQQACVYLCLEK